jgi:sterol desaturase/sphingolipid hydroxylase (fatty acid hydroxylase superfamily)
LDTRIIALAIPFFFLLIGLEMVVSRIQRVPRYRFHDSITSLSCGTGEQVIVVFTAGLAVLAYAYAEKHLAVTHIPMRSPVAWLLVFVLVDHSYYWFHRASHRVNFLWAGHSVHHQSEEYNLSTALRQNWIENLLAWPFYVPLAVVGFPLAMFATASTLNTLYQFWVHTRVIRRLGPVEGVLNTPSSHRVHHGIDPKYVDRNYGGMFMLWDRLYGTYQPEEEEPHYGTVKPLESWSPLWANVDGWVRLARMARATSRAKDKLYVLLAPPEWRPADLGGPVVVPEVDPASYKKYDTEAPRAIDRYVLVQFGIAAAVTSAIMWFARDLPGTLVAAGSCWVLAALVGWGGLFEGKAWAVPLEMGRHAAGVALGVLLMVAGYGEVVLAGAVLAGAVSMGLLARGQSAALRSNAAG